EVVREIDVAERPADQRHQHALGQRGDDPPESRSADHADSHAEHVASFHELLELFYPLKPSSTRCAELITSSPHSQVCKLLEHTFTCAIYLTQSGQSCRLGEPR